MGCTKCRQEQIKEIKHSEIVNPYIKKKEVDFIPVSILDTLNNKIDYNNVYTKREVLEDEEIKKLDAIIKKIKINRRLILLLKKCQSRIIGIQYRKKLRFENLRRAETVTLENLLKRDIPLKKYQIDNFFRDNPPLETEPNLRIIKSNPIILENKIIYLGEWDTNFYQRYGRGIQIYPDGSYYKGYWENNKAEGKGEFIHSSGDKYVGNWHNNKRHGKGIYNSKDGKEYEGYWKNDKPDGEGKEIINVGNIYIGAFSKGKRNGHGRLQMKNGCIYEGNFKDGKMNGKGIYTFTDKRVYEGDFINNTFEGKGIYTWPNGNKYKGHFKNNQREGFGTFYFKNGKKIRGLWNKGELEGEYEIYSITKERWIKKKAKEKEDNNLDNEDVKLNNNKIFKEENKDNDVFNNGQILDDSEFDNLGEIKKSEEIKIELNGEDEFQLKNQSELQI